MQLLARQAGDWLVGWFRSGLLWLRGGGAGERTPLGSAVLFVLLIAG
jgi:hypothetical protein